MNFFISLLPFVIIFFIIKSIITTTFKIKKLRQQGISANNKNLYYKTVSTLFLNNLPV